MNRNLVLIVWAVLAIGTLLAGHIYFTPKPDKCRPIALLVNTGVKC